MARAKGFRTHDRGGARCRSRMRPVILGLLLLHAACASQENSPGPPPPPRFPHRGESITSTQLCTCKVCEPRACCEDEGLSAPDDTGGMGLSVTSCEPRCRQEAWRVRNNQTCEVKRPPDCCRE